MIGVVMPRLAIFAALGLVCWAPPSLAIEPMEFTVFAGAVDRQMAPVRVPLSLPDEAAKSSVTVTLPDGGKAAAQITASSLAADAGNTHELWFIVPELRAGETNRFKAEFSPSPEDDNETFAWRDEPGKHADLLFDSRPVLRYMHQRLDESSPERRQETYKPYHHVYDPQGKRLVTKGPGGLFPHHRGLFFGFNRISYGDHTADTWHCNNGESQTHEEFLAAEAGPVLGRHRTSIAWRGKDGSPFASEERELTAFRVTGGTMIDFASRLSTTLPLVKLDGDPQHAGFQFRASQEVPDATKELTYYIRPDGIGKPGEFRNWPDDPSHIDLPWHAMAFMIGGQRYTCCRLDRPENPRPARYSERDYGRFGSYFEYELTPERPLVVRYRLWLQEGEMTVEQVAALSRQFAEPPIATIE
jgi:hypothetical protein